jgi:DNA mismatch repair protein MutL
MPLADRGRARGRRLSGYAGLPTYNRGNAAHQYLFVNGRPVRDKLLQGAVRGAYADFLARDRHPGGAVPRSAPRWSTSTSIRPRPRCASAMPAWCAADRGRPADALAAAGHRARATTVSDAALGAFPPQAGSRAGADGRRAATANGNGYSSVPRKPSPRPPPAAPPTGCRPASEQSGPEHCDPDTIRWAWRAPSSTRPTSWPRPRRAS